MVRVALITCAFSYWVGIFVLTHLPPSVPVPLDIQVSDKLLHFGAFAVLGFLLALSYSAFRPLTRGRFGLLLGLLASYAALDEMSQRLVGRSAALGDWFADLVGVIVGIGLFIITYRTWQQVLVAVCQAKSPQDISDFVKDVPHETRAHRAAAPLLDGAFAKDTRP